MDSFPIILEENTFLMATFGISKQLVSTLKHYSHKKNKSNKNHVETRLILKVPWKTLNSNIKVALH